MTVRALQLKTMKSVSCEMSRAFAVLLVAVAVALATESKVVVESEECWLSALAGPVLTDGNDSLRPSCQAAAAVPLVGLLVASSMCESCLAFRPALIALSPQLQLVLVSRDPNAVRFRRHLRSLGATPLAVPLDSPFSESANALLDKPSLPSVSDV